MEDIVNLNIVDMTEDGRGIGKTEDNFTVFTDSALPGDKVIARIHKRKKRYAEAETLEITEFSKDRQERLCPTDTECGGCDFMEYKYEAQIKLKQNKVENLLKKFADIELDESKKIVEDIISPNDKFNYRNKAILHLDSKHKRIGYFSKKSHDVIEMEDCLINSRYAVEIKRKISELLNQLNASDLSSEPSITEKSKNDNKKIYNLDYSAVKSFNSIRDILIRSSKDGSELMLVLIAENREKDDSRNKKKCKSNASNANNRNIINQKSYEFIVENIVNSFPNIKSIILNINDSKKFLLGRESYVLYGNSYITDYIEDLSFKISPETFFQINPEITEKMYAKVLEYCDLKGDEVVYDIYSGIGTISLFLSRNAEKVIGIEVVEKSVLNAMENAEANNIQNAEFEFGKAEVLLPKHSNSGKKADIIVVDPPRKGCEKEVLEAMMDMNPEKIVYVSCNPATLARDLNILSDKYRVEKVQPFDMFPWTNHVETVVKLSKIKKRYPT